MKRSIAPKINIKKIAPTSSEIATVENQRKIVIDPGTSEFTEYERQYYSGYPYRFWFHKARAIYYFIEDVSRLQYLRAPNDIDTNDYIIDNLKMEIHMMLFHSAESLFLTVLGHYFYPVAPWLWMSSCEQRTTRDIMNFWRAKGLDAIIKEPQTAEEWLREILYPNVIESGKNYQKAKDSAAFIKKFLDRMVTYYMDHNEYNAYKHGLKSFSGWGGLTAINDATQNLEYSSHGDLVVFLKYTRLKGIHNGEPLYGYRIKHSSKRYDVELDINRIEVITGILQNFLEEKHVQFKARAWQKSRDSSVYFDCKRVDDYFSLGLSEMSE